jgi:hypothetical protein
MLPDEKDVKELIMNAWNDTSKGRRAFLAGTSALAGGALLQAASAEAMASRYAQSLRLFAEGDARADWVLSLLPVPAPPAVIPVRARYRFPAIESGHAGKDVLSVRVFMQRDVYEIAISGFLVAVEHVAIARAAFGGDDNPENNLLMSGRVIAVDPEAIQPFGDLVGRAFGMGCGFLWDDAQHSAAVFRLFAGSAAGSHVTVLPEAEGFLEIDRPWDSY